jgi:hypothetical protein
MDVVVYLATTPGKIQALVQNNSAVTVMVDEIILTSEAEIIYQYVSDFAYGSGRVGANSTRGLVDIPIAGLKGAVVATANYYRVDSTTVSEPLTLP